ncbi:MAG: SUMF1/EgtB/PvdO family nonheme iron enzyme, partial [Burkholderiales bacterium]|nr:SUMF1/EgtB/PvdO family nonheme iron enzyme [Anaerolineae bacterium]
LRAGQEWWDEIVRQLECCDGFVYLLSSDSINSQYCQKELDIALEHGKHIFPVLIHRSAIVPSSLQHIQHVDFCDGLDIKAVKSLLDSIYLAERVGKPTRSRAFINGKLLPVTSTLPPAAPDPATVVDESAEAMENGDYDRAVFLLKQAKASGCLPRFINLETMLTKAENALEAQMFRREAEREYKPIAALVKRKSTRAMGCEAFQAFRQSFPDYDPDGLGAVCATVVLPMLEWCDIPGGQVTMEYEKKAKNYQIADFRLSKHPITNAQFQLFVDAEDGYRDERWWAFSTHAKTWHQANPDPLPPRFLWSDHPRSNICWYEASAFCNWLHFKTGLSVKLPTEQQWQRAAQGDDGRIYPWGNRYDKSLCNSRESGIRMTTPVTRYPEGASPFGVLDMAGNTWEWCLTSAANPDVDSSTAETPRPVRGGSFIGEYHRARTTFRFYLNPQFRYATISFRVVCNMPMPNVPR